MTQSGPEFFRKYADIITEAEQAQHLDEGVVDTIKQKISGIFASVKNQPGWAEAYAKAKTMTPQLKQILASSKSSDEVVDKIKQLVGTNNPAPVAEAEDKDILGGALMGGGVLTAAAEHAAGLLDMIFTSHAATMATMGWLVLPILFVILGCYFSLKSE